MAQSDPKANAAEQMLRLMFAKYMPHVTDEEFSQSISTSFIDTNLVSSLLHACFQEIEESTKSEIDIHSEIGLLRAFEEGLESIIKRGSREFCPEGLKKFKDSNDNLSRSKLSAQFTTADILHDDYDVIKNAANTLGIPYEDAIEINAPKIP